MKKSLYIAPVTETVNIEVESHLAAPSNWSVDGGTIPISNGDGNNPPTDEEPTGAKRNIWESMGNNHEGMF